MRARPDATPTAKRTSGYRILRMGRTPVTRDPVAAICIPCVVSSHAARSPRRSGNRNAERFSRAAPPKNIGSQASSFRLGSSASGFPPPGSNRGCATSRRRSEEVVLSDAKIASFFSPSRSPRNAPGFLSLSGASLPLRRTTGPVRLARAGRLTTGLERRPGIGAKPGRRASPLSRCRSRARIKFVAAAPKEENTAAVRRPPAGEPTCRLSIPPAAAMGRDCVAGFRWGLVTPRLLCRQTSGRLRRTLRQDVRARSVQANGMQSADHPSAHCRRQVAWNVFQ